MSRPTALDSVRSAKSYNGNREHSRLNDILWLGPLVIRNTADSMTFYGLVLRYFNVKRCSRMVYSLSIVASQRDQNYISLSKIQGGGSVDGRLGFVWRPRVKAIDLLTIEACEFLGDIVLRRTSFWVSIHVGRFSCSSLCQDQQLSIPCAVPRATVEIRNTADSMTFYGSVL